MKLKKLYLIILAIRSGDYYMYDYESDEEEVDEGKLDEATVAQEQVYLSGKTK
jgi:hypothetical protein